MEEKEIAQWIENGLRLTKVETLSWCEVSLYIVYCASCSVECISYFKTLCFQYLDFGTKLCSSCTVASVVIHNRTVIKHNICRLIISTEFCVKAPSRKGAL